MSRTPKSGHQLLDLLKAHQGRTFAVAEMMATLGLQESTVQKALKRMLQQRLIHRSGIGGASPYAYGYGPDPVPSGPPKQEQAKPVHRDLRQQIIVELRAGVVPMSQALLIDRLAAPLPDVVGSLNDLAAAGSVRRYSGLWGLA